MIHLTYFSATGNTEFLATELKEILYLKENQFTRFGQPIPENCSHLIVMFPIHGFNPARPVKKEFESMIQSVKRVSLIAVGCNDTWLNAAASLPLKHKLSTQELCVDEVLTMPLAFMVEFPKEIGHKLIENSLAKLEKIKDQIERADFLSRPIGNRSKIITKLGSLESSAARLFGLELHATKACTGCSICQSACSFKNIKFKNHKPAFGLKCGLCMNCIYVCPQKAIKPYISRFLPLKNGYSLQQYLER